MQNNSSINLSESEYYLINAFPGALAIIDYDGRILSVNDEWQKSENENNYFGDGRVGENYFDYCKDFVKNGSDYALKLLLGLRNLLDGERTFFEMTYPLKSGDKQKWFRVQVNPYQSEGAILLFEEITNSVTAIRALRDSEERYKQHFEHAQSGILIGTPEGGIKDVNPSACRILGYTREELITGGRAMVMDMENPVNKNAQKVRAEKSKYEGEKQYIHKSGRIITVHVSSVMFRNENGEFNSINTFKDITKQKEVEQTLENEQKFIKTSIESIPGTFFVVDQQGKLIRWNEAVETDLGYTPDMIKKMVVTDFVFEEDQQKVQQTMQKIFEEGEGTVVAAVKTVNNGIRQHKLNAKSFTQDGENFLVGTGVDITDLVEAEKARKENFHMMEQLFENSPLGIVLIDVDNSVRKANKSFKTMFGYESDDFKDKSISELIAKGEQKEVADRISNDSFEGKSTQYEGVRYTKRGERRTVYISSIPVKNNDEVIAVYGIYVDITEQKELENRIKELLSLEKVAREKVQSSLNEKEVLLQEVHHRVKNNLAVMAGLLDLQLMEETEKDVIQKLSEVQSRIYSIAKIHETLYQEENMVSIKYHEYLKSFITSLPQFSSTNSNGTTNFILESDEILLNLNQAVPFGLMLNEMLNVLYSEVESEGSSISLILKQYDDNISLQIKGESLDLLNLIKNRHSENFQYKLIDIFLDQLNANIELDKKEQKIIISFKKMSIRGSSSSFLMEEVN